MSILPTATRLASGASAPVSYASPYLLGLVVAYAIVPC